MRVTGLLLIATFTAACGGATTDEPKQLAASDQQRDRQQVQQSVPPPAPAPPSRSADSPRPAGTAGKASALPEPRVASPATANATAVALADFKTRVDAYADLHKELAKGSAKQRETDDPAKINNAEAALAAKVQAARSQAKQGDIFTPAVRPIFRRLLAPELKGKDGRDNKAILADDAPAPGSVPFKVNAKYPDAQPLPTVPANVLATLPELPAPLEYRIVGQHLLLLDTSSDLIADYMLNAIVK
jgi:hypothetical protein